MNENATVQIEGDQCSVCGTCSVVYEPKVPGRLMVTDYRKWMASPIPCPECESRRSRKSAAGVRRLMDRRLKAMFQRIVDAVVESPVDAISIVTQHVIEVSARDFDIQLGSCLLRPFMDGFYLSSLYVNADHRKSGIGTRLVKRAFDLHNCQAPIYLCARAYLDGEMSNDDLVQWYERLGFVRMDTAGLYGIPLMKLTTWAGK